MRLFFSFECNFVPMMSVIDIKNLNFGLDL